jgi:hypothetical protein
MQSARACSAEPILRRILRGKGEGGGGGGEEKKIDIKKVSAMHAEASARWLVASQLRKAPTPRPFHDLLALESAATLVDGNVKYRAKSCRRLFG